VKRANEELDGANETDFEKQEVTRTVSTKRRKARKNHGEALPGRFCFRVNSDEPTYQQYAQYSDSRNREVKRLRSTGGACISCRLVKKQVS
jgi:hypothetical protein